MQQNINAYKRNQPTQSFQKNPNQENQHHRLSSDMDMFDNNKLAPGHEVDMLLQKPLSFDNLDGDYNENEYDSTQAFE